MSAQRRERLLAFEEVSGHSQMLCSVHARRLEDQPPCYEGFGQGGSVVFLFWVFGVLGLGWLIRSVLATASSSSWGLYSSSHPAIRT